MRVTAMVAIVAGALLAPAAASGGGWATVGLSPTPDGVAAGKPWVVDMTVLQHGRTPLDGVRPAVIVTRSDGGASRTFAAVATGQPGAYRARVVFPSAGRWDYVVDDGFSARHSFAAVRVDAPAARGAPVADGGGSELWTALGAGSVAGLAAALLAWVVMRKRRIEGEPAVIAS